jgi:hypothetical protein
MSTLDAHAIRLLSAQAVMDPRSVRRAYSDPNKVRNGTLVRLVQAARALGLPTPVGANEVTATVADRREFVRSSLP